MHSPESPSNDHHFRREDRILRWQRIANHISEHPDELSIALENIDRWLTLGRVHPSPLLDWKHRIQSAQTSPTEFRKLIAFLAAPNHDSEPIKSCSPFVGLSLPAPIE